MSVFDANVIGNGIKCFCLSCSILHVPIFLHNYLFGHGNKLFFVESFLGPSKIIKVLPINYSGLLPHEGVHANAVTKKLKGIYFRLSQKLEIRNGEKCESLILS